MPPPADDMADLDQPVTRRELRQELEAAFKNVATKDDLKAFMTREEVLRTFATKEDLKAFMTRDEALRTFATKEDLKAFAMKDDLKAMSEELGRYFDVVAESFKSHFNALHDWVKANVNGLAERVETLETDHGSRLLNLETCITALEPRRLKRPRKQ